MVYSSLQSDRQDDTVGGKAIPTKNLREVLSQVFGFPDYRGIQRQAIASLMQGENVLALMPTGGGKSLCYQLPGLCRAGTTLVISPLIALMEDQVAHLCQLGLKACAWHSELSPEEAQKLTQAMQAGEMDFVYVSPERLTTGNARILLRKIPLSLIAIDEAHCVSLWGHEFRPEYRALVRLGEWFPNVPRIALTATADLRTKTDILTCLNIPQAKVYESSFHRPNIHISVQMRNDEKHQLLGILSRHKEETSIIYCNNRKKTERLAAFLSEKGWPAIAYHAGCSAEEKKRKLAFFRSGEALVVVATVAFGMGIDRPDVRLVVHVDMPDSLEAYYQQIGRAGRDGGPAEAVMLAGSEDIAQHHLRLYNSAYSSSTQGESTRQRMRGMARFAHSTECRTKTILQSFGEELAEPCGHCDNCLSPPEMEDITQECRMALSTVYRTGQAFGMTHLIAVLQGKKNANILRYHHDGLSVFGLGRQKSTFYWKGVLRHLLAIGALDYDGQSGGFSLPLKLGGQNVRPLLRGELPVLVNKHVVTEIRPSSGRYLSSVQKALPKALTEQEQESVKRLKEWRLEVAKIQAVPPYIVFQDTVLGDIARIKPQSLEELATIKGVGQTKLARYGATVLRVLWS
ncbi:DNA helicase RecQ [Entomobacter blattae]|uniref:DNA helicase RecQ n=1 Tax=Entomobacter blattae TaxID=2762277 RepID=A0A7H1NS37_9PROT|nr:DNA helicase RecQ [Entomobacter blattae]QNT78597.1 ATP-dependent DNA helicase RecQ [Entomobacter blattae]